jgi:hypothetical protein
MQFRQSFKLKAEDACTKRYQGHIYIIYIYVEYIYREREKERERDRGRESTMQK